MIAENVDAVVGVDTHTDTHSGCLVSALGVQLATLTVPATAAGYLELLRWAVERAPGARLVWAVEGTRSHGSGLARALIGSGQTVVEAARPPRVSSRAGGKSDPRDAYLAARQALAAEHIAQPRSDGPREALRLLLVSRNTASLSRTAAVNTLKAFILTAPDEVRSQLRDLTVPTQLSRISRLRTRSGDTLERRTLIHVLKELGSRIAGLNRDLRANEQALTAAVHQVLPELLNQVGIGAFSAAQLLVSFSHAGRCRSEAAFAALGGVAPLEASSGRVVRHRLNRHGDRQLNRALHTITMSRLRYDPATQAYRDRRSAEGKSEREIRRCLKRYIARALFRQMQSPGRQGANGTVPTHGPSTARDAPLAA